MLPGAVGVIVILRLGVGVLRAWLSVSVIRAVVSCSFGRSMRWRVAGHPDRFAWAWAWP